VFFGVAAVIGQARDPDVAVAAASWLGVMNGLLAVFNLLPDAPLDGGRVLRAALWRRYGDRDRAATSAARSGRYLGVLLAVLGIAELLVTGDFLGGPGDPASHMAARSPLGGEVVAVVLNHGRIVGRRSSRSRRPWASAGTCPRAGRWPLPGDRGRSEASCRAVRTGRRERAAGAALGR
jgi:Peptidase family M50